MKVNISYSVALEKVLPLIEKLYLENKQEFSTLYDKTTQVIEKSFTEEGVQGALSQITELRKGMVEFDGKLGELLGITKGYQHIINGGGEEQDIPVAPFFSEEDGDEPI